MTLPARPKRPLLEVPENKSGSDGGPTEAAEYIAERVSELTMLARRHGLDAIALLLDMAKLEAEETRLRALTARSNHRN